MSRLEYLIAGGLLRLVRLIASRLPVRPDKVVLATARVSTLDGNLLHIHRALQARHPELDVSGLYHTLRNMERSPAERLARGLAHGKLRPRLG